MSERSIVPHCTFVLRRYGRNSPRFFAASSILPSRQSAIEPSACAVQPSGRSLTVRLRDVEQLLELMQVAHCCLQLRDRVGDQFFRVEQLVGVVQLLVAEPLEAVELVVALLDLVDGEAAPAVLRRVGSRIAWLRPFGSAP